MPSGRHRRRSAPTRAEAVYFSESERARRRANARSWDTTELGAGLNESQMAGIAALISLANQAATVTRSGEMILASAESQPQQSKLQALSKRIREDQMTWNSLYLVLNTGLQAAFGFMFWIVAAHLFSVGEVGRATALVSASSLIGSVTLFGLNTGIGRYLPDSHNPHALISCSLTLVAACGAVGALLYILLTPFIAPKLSFVEKSPALTVGFALITSTNALNTLTDSVFVASRRAKYSTFTDGIVGGIGKVIFAFALAGAGTYGAFVASTMGVVLASVASLILIFTTMHSRLDLKRPLHTLKPLLKFSGANYIGNVFSMVPGLVVPVILLDRTGAESAAYFFVVFQIAQIVYAAAFALEQTFLAEGSRANADMRSLKRRSRRILVMLCVPAALSIVGGGRWLLLAFGRSYYQNGYISLVILALAAGPIAANYWFLTVLRLAGKLRAIVGINATYAVGTCLLAWVGAPHGLSAVAVAWFGGALIAACVAAVVSREGYVGNRRPSGDSRMVNGIYGPRRNTKTRPQRVQRAVNPNQLDLGS
jgi:O-antigen/teichoic acid export membrane protein